MLQEQFLLWFTEYFENSCNFEQDGAPASDRYWGDTFSCQVALGLLWRPLSSLLVPSLVGPVLGRLPLRHKYLYQTIVYVHEDVITFFYG